MKRSGSDFQDLKGNILPDSKRMTRATAGKKEWKWKHYFGQFSDDVLDKIEMDETALFSVTIDRDADVISKAVRANIPDYAMVCDATACVGGNTISFAKVFRHVTSIEMDPTRFEMLKKNVSLSGYANHVNFVNMDFLKYKENMPNFDFIFFDPPWGGENYQEESSIDMYLSNISIADVVLSLRNKTRFIGLKSPMNFRLSAFEKRIKARKIFSREFTISKNKDTYWLFTLYEFDNELNGGILHMLSPSFDSSMISQIKTSQKTAFQSPSYKESDFISSHIIQSCTDFDTLIDLTASIGIQDINFLSCSHFMSHIYLSPKPIELEHNIRVLLPRLSTQPQVHFLHIMETTSLKDRLHDNRRVLTGSNCCVYVDLFNELSVEQIKNLDSTKKVTVNKIPLEVLVQQCIEYCVNLDSIRKVIVRVPKQLEAGITSALGCFETAVYSYQETNSLSSCCPARETCLILVEPAYPTTNQLAKIWSTLPHCILRKQLNSIFSAVLADRSNVLSMLTQAMSQKPARSDQDIWELARKAYFTSFNLSPTATIDKTMAIKVDRSIVRVYGNKMKYVDMVVPVGCRPQQILCLGGVDAHLAHDLAKMYNCSQKEQVIVFGEGDRRKEESRTDYCFVPYPEKGTLSWTEYREQLLIRLHEALINVSEIDMVVVCCPHAVPFFGSILSSIINKLSPDAVLVLNDHSVTTQSEEVLLNLVHDFHRKVTSSHVDTLLDREELSQVQELDEDDKCSYSSGNNWEERLKQYGLTRYVSEKNKQLWSTNDPNNLLKSIWGCFQYNGLRD